jgi:hypothetical protein
MERVAPNVRPASVADPFDAQLSLALLNGLELFDWPIRRQYRLKAEHEQKCSNNKRLNKRARPVLKTM